MGPTDAMLDQECAYQTGPGVPLGVTYPWSNGLEWVSVGAKSAAQLDPANYVYQTIQGWIKPSGSFKAQADNPDGHQCFDIENPPWPSDWNIDLRPFPGSDPLLGPGNFANNLQIELENELCVMQWFFGATGGFPFPGDLVTVTGKWIADCGHQPNNTEFLTEIHPWALFSRAETVSMASQGFSFNANATFQPIAVNGIIVDLAAINVYPPPRPSPNAQLYSITTGQDGAYGNLKVVTTLYSDHINMLFDAPQALPIVEPNNGEVDNNFSRGFQGIAYAFWQ